MPSAGKSYNMTNIRCYLTGHNSKNAKPNLHQLVMALKDPKLYLGALMVGAQGIGIGAFSVFLPTFIAEFGFSELDTELYSMVPYAFALVTMLSFSYVADRLSKRGIMTLVCLSTTIIGFVILMATTNKVALLAGACFVAAGSYPGTVIGISWALSLHGGYTKRSCAAWFMSISVNAQAIVSSQVYRKPPRYLAGHGVALGSYVLATVCTLILIYLLSRANRAKDQRAADFASRQEIDPDMAEDYEHLGDYHPAFRYML
jgi:MFS family permease